MDAKTSTQSSLRNQIGLILILVSAGLMFGRILAVDDLFERAATQIKVGQIESRLNERKKLLEKEKASPQRIQSELRRFKQSLENDAARAQKNQRPFLSANDRSRWCTIRALVEPDMRVLDKNENVVWFAIDKVQEQPGWNTIDMVKHPLPPDNRKAPAYLYSSKPPLLPVLMAVPYYLIYNGTGGRISFETELYFVVRAMLVVINLIPLVVCWFLMSRLVDRFAKNDWSYCFIMAFVCFGTFASTFCNTLNNHIPGICCVIVSMYAAVRILFDGKRSIWYFFTAGLFASFLPACELPGLAYTVFLLTALLCVAPLRTFFGFVPIMVLVMAAFFQTNFIAHQTYGIAYGNKSWYEYEYERGGRTRDSYWKNRVGIDNGEKSHVKYFLHTTVGHHGIFSLTPVWCLSVLGGAMCLRRKWSAGVPPANKNDAGEAPALQKADGTFALRYFQASIFVLVLSLICYVFYQFRPEVDRNYGGMTSGLRWMFWFMPLWTFMMIPAVNRLSQNRFARGCCLVLLFVSVMSVAYPITNPWQHPWFFNLMYYWNWDMSFPPA